jgi:hypothetical protein
VNILHRFIVQDHKNEHVCSTKRGEAIESIRGLNLTAAKLMTVQVTKLPLQRKISKTGMICFAKPGLTDDLYTVQERIV